VIKYSHQYSLSILAYSLMPNHDHVICIPPQSNTLELVFKPVHLRYAQHLNWYHSISGRLWQGRFFSCPMDVFHLWAAIRYVERNPVRAGIVQQAEKYPWSSAAAHCGLRDDPLISPIPEALRLAVPNWSEWLATIEEENILKKIRRHTRTGRPIGEDSFISDLELRLGRKVRACRVGRPQKVK